MDFTKVIAGAIALLAAVLSGLLIPWIRSKTGKAQWDQLVEWTKTAVAAAELLFLGSSRGEEKREYVTQWLRDRGIYFDDEIIRAVLEAAVLSIKNEKLGQPKE